MPAAAVKRGGRALSGLTGRKVRVNSCEALCEKSVKQAVKMQRAKLEFASGGGMSGVEVKFEEIRRNTIAKAAARSKSDVEARKRGHQKGFDTPVVQAVNNG